ncbi:MAG: hypothetical protein QS748_11605 [Candidatus Endonucleobacter bathymodioli]|uniref:Uncharacterized protein n=1 Tax=Candidatus Endonucleibacter bathymodioli TaxID=539814 RepID=A0AA90NSK6_9GAMM|nr:hypothetical protein [Candidatus Endonucleobacter bathymodioli]
MNSIEANEEESDTSFPLGCEVIGGSSMSQLPATLRGLGFSHSSSV